MATLDDAKIPERYRSAKFTTFDDVMPIEWLGEAGVWLHSQKGLFHRAGDVEGCDRFGYELLDIGEIYKPIAELTAEIAKRIGEAVEKVGIPDFDLELVECHATLYHHGGRFTWHRDAEPPSTRRLAFAFYLRTEPSMYSGGELEFLDGTMVEPKVNRLVVFDPDQQHRVRPVECWSADFLHGRWAIVGWLHGKPAE
jgi:hypothetical protein